MIEVEAKVKIGDLKKIREKAKLIARHIGKEKKIDDYYSLENLNVYPKKSLRIRERKGFYEVNFKQSISFNDKIHAKRETEFRVSDINGFLALIDDFGFKKWLRKEKETEVYEIGKNFHIEINNVKSLGYFIEVEYLCKTEGEIGKAKIEVLKVIDKLGIARKELTGVGYTKMLWDNKIQKYKK